MRGTVLSRVRLGAKQLLRDQGGNALMLTAAAVVPVIGIVGSAVDIGRAYMTQLRLQQACDAGVLAGRRAMAGGDYNDPPKAEANKMFNFNFPANIYGSENISFTSTASSNKTDVNGTASATLPSAIMFMFGTDQFNLTANCAAKLEISNTDVVLVLDVTGSMEATNPGDSVSKIQALRDASMVFFDTLTKAEIGDGRLRFGIVPYSGTVNVGGILNTANPAWISDSVTVPSRSPRYKSNGSFDKYRYENRTFNVSGGKGGANMTFNTGTNGANLTSNWDGCIMERKTTAFNQNTTAPADAYDMDINMVPTSNDDTKWKMFLADFAYSRSGSAVDDTTTNRTSFGKAAEDINVDVGACPPPAMKLTEMDAAGKQKFKDKIAELKPQGFTYHDSGMVWGARLISPTGLFATENTTVTNKRPISRHIIFMTDGTMTAPRSNFSHQGQEQVIARIGATSDDNAVARHNNRFEQLCSRAKNMPVGKNDAPVVIWVIGFGVTLNSQLTQCATVGKAYQTGSATKLKGIFQSIADQISRLRLSQ
jgi:Flp pilus assembly protein TadG